MNNHQQLYTLGNWTVKPDSEEKFITEWESFAKWTSKKFSGAGIGYLLQDSTNPSMFISFGAWDSIESINKWRGLPEFNAFAEKVKNLCTKFEPHNMVLVASTNE